MGLVSRATAALGPGISAARSFQCCKTRFALQVRGLGCDRALERAERTARDLEAQLDAFDPASAVAELNREGAVTNRHVARVVERGLEYCERTDGAFDVTIGGLVNLWSFGPEARPREVPDSTVLNARLAEIGMQALTLDREGLRARRTRDVFVDLSGVAKGYATDRLAAFKNDEAPVGRVAAEVPGGADAGEAGADDQHVIRRVVVHPLLFYYCRRTEHKSM